MLPGIGDPRASIAARWRRVAPAALLAALLAAVAPGAEAVEACGQGADEIIVRVNAVRSDSGSIVAVLYGDNPDDFLKKGRRLDKVFEPATEGTVDVCLTAPEPGTYAVAIYHDENGNAKFDKNWIGIPNEGYGISNNPTTFLGPPSFEQAKFEALEGSTVIDIEVKY